MFDIDPPSPVLRLDVPRKGTQPTALTDRQHMARIAQEGPWFPRHSIVCITGVARKSAGYVFKGSIEQLREVSDADRCLAQRIDAL